MYKNSINFSNILEKYSAPVYEKEYIIPKDFSLNNISNDFHYIKNIKVQPFSQNQTNINTKLQVNYIKITLGINNCIYERENTKLRLCVDKSDFINYNIDFPTSVMYKYQNQQLMLRTGGVDCKLFKIIVTGLRFNELDTFVNESIEYKHDSKYYQEGKFCFKTQGGMGGKNTNEFPYWYKQDYDAYSIENLGNQLTLKDMEKITLVCNENEQDYNLFVTNNNVSLVETLVLNDKNNNDFLVGKVETNELKKFDYIRLDNNKMSITYYLNNVNNDVLYSFKILNKLPVLSLYSVNATIDLSIGNKTIFTNNININDINDTITLYNILINKYNNINLSLKITCDEKYIDYLETLIIDVGVGFVTKNLKKAIIKTDLSLCRYL